MQKHIQTIQRFLTEHFAVIVFVATCLFFALFFVWPIVVTVWEAFVSDESQGFTLDYIFGVLQNNLYREGLFNAFSLALASTLGCILIAVPLAVINDRFKYPGKAILASLILIPLILPPFVGAIGVKQILGMEGALNHFLMSFGLMSETNPVDWLGEGRFLGIVIMNALHLFPILYLNVSASMANLDPAMEEAAQNLGCKPWRRFLRITVPLTMPGIFAGCTIIFIWAFTELGVPLIFDYQRVTSVQIFDGIKDLGDDPTPYALVVIMLVSTLGLFLLSKFFFGRSNFVMTSRASIARQSREPNSQVGKWLCTGAFVSVFALAVIPHIGVVIMSVSTDWYRSVLPESFTLQHFEDSLGHDLTVPSIGNSLVYATLSTLVDLALGISIAYVVVRTRIRGRHLLDAMAMLPLAVPGLVLAFGYLAMTREGQTFDFLLLGKNSNPILLLVIAYSVRRLPYIVRSAAAGFQQTSVTLEEAAQNLGASPARALKKITLPLIAANLIAGALLAFSFAMLEVSDSLLLAEQREHFPITKAIYSLLTSLGNGSYLASALGVWAMLFLAVTIVGAGILLGKKLGALFRV